MNILIYNSIDCHHEVFGYIIDFCRTYNHNIDILSAGGDIGMIEWYIKWFNNYCNFINHVDIDNNSGRLINYKNEKYDYIFLTTDDDFNNNYIQSIYNIKDFNYTNCIVIEHLNQIRNPLVLNRIAIRYYKTRIVDYAYSCYNVLSYNEKSLILKNENCINICIVSYPDHYNLNKEYKKLFKLNENIHIYNITRSPSLTYNLDEISQKYNNKVSFYINLDFSKLENILKKCHYIYIPNYTHEIKNKSGEFKKVSLSGIIPTSYNYGCKIIFPESDWKSEYNLTSCYEYSENLKLSKLPFKDVFIERDGLIEHRNRVFNNILNKSIVVDNKPVIRHKIPKIIFQTWETKDLSPVLNTSIDLIKKNNIDYQHYLFDAKDRYDFIKDNFSDKILKVYDAIIPGALKSDFWRYCILYIYGGIYCDIDMICMNSFDNAIKDDIEFVTPIDLGSDNCTKNNYFLVNAFIGIIPKHNLMKLCIDKIVDTVINNRYNKSWNALDMTGPGVLGRMFNQYLSRNQESDLRNLEGIYYIDKVINNKIETYKISLLNFNKSTEFISNHEDTIILQNKNGNLHYKSLYLRDIKRYNLISWVDNYNSGNKFYNLISEIDNIL
jgi:hypothetical protein